MTRCAIYAGTFDPLTLGHLDLIERSAEIFDHLTIAVAEQSNKDALFDAVERVAMAREVIEELKLANVEVEPFHSLLVDFARKKDCRILIRGLRAYSDFENEFQMALTNRKLASSIETLFMMPKEIHSYVSSSTVRVVARFGGNITEFVPDPVCRAIDRKLGRHTA
jgi:pantetheine-phosphate adenylyltransferase